MAAEARTLETARVAVLIVDDDPINLFVLDEFLQGAGFPTLTATNGAEAVEMYARYLPPLILMDLSMPVMDGFEATRRIFSAPPSRSDRPVVLAVSANVTPEWRTTCLDMGMEDFIEKPIDFEVLIPKIESISDSLMR